MNRDPSPLGPRWGLLLLAVVACAQVGAGAPAPKPPRADLPYLKQVRARLDVARARAPLSRALPSTAPRSAGPDTRLLSLTTGDGAIGDRFGSSLAREGDVLLAGAPFDVVVRAGVRGGVAGGTVRAYYRHSQSNDLLARPGEQDLTCHVCWDWLASALRRHGFAEPALDFQETFFVRHAGDLIASASAEDAARFSPRKRSP